VDDGWSMTELAERVAQALTADGVRAPNGRIREVPDPRAIRWYATIGLVDRPRMGRQRAGRYTARHLLQVVAVKRRQAEGRSLAEIQAELAGATDHTLRAVAQVPDALLQTAPTDHRAPARPRFWTAPAPAPAQSAVPVAAALDAAESHAAPRDTTAPDARTAVPKSDDASDRTPSDRTPSDRTPSDGGAAVRYLIALPGGVTLALPAAPTPADLVAVHAAAAPLLDLLAHRGLTTPPDPQTKPTHGQSRPTDKADPRQGRPTDKADPRQGRARDEADPRQSRATDEADPLMKEPDDDRPAH
jgi:DNA-binding transcriptional MerR regulator